MRFTIILATVDRVKEVKAFLASLDSQTHRDFDLIVVDQNPDERLEAVISTYRGRFTISHVRTDRLGLSRARNLGIKHAEGKVVTFPDDDCLYPPRLLESVAEFFDGNLTTGCLTGRSVDRTGCTSNGRFHMESGNVDKFNVWFRGIEYTTFVRLGSLRRVRFDERLGIGAGTIYGAGEGVDFLMSLVEDGVRVHYDPDLTVLHEPPFGRYDHETFRKAYSYGAGMSFVIRRHKMPLSFRARWLARAAGACVLALGRVDIPETGFRLSILAGRIKGLIS